MKIGSYVRIKFGSSEHQGGDIGVIRGIDTEVIASYLVEVAHSIHKPYMAYLPNSLELLEFQPGDIVVITKGGGGVSNLDKGKLLQVITPESGKIYQNNAYKGMNRILCRFIVSPECYQTSLYVNSRESVDGWWVSVDDILKATFIEEDDWSILDKSEEDFSCLNDL